MLSLFNCYLTYFCLVILRVLTVSITIYMLVKPKVHIFPSLYPMLQLYMYIHTTLHRHMHVRTHIHISQRHLPQYQHIQNWLHLFSLQSFLFLSVPFLRKWHDYPSSCPIQRRVNHPRVFPLFLPMQPISHQILSLFLIIPLLSIHTSITLNWATIIS